MNLRSKTEVYHRIVDDCETICNFQSLSDSKLSIICRCVGNVGLSCIIAEICLLYPETRKECWSRKGKIIISTNSIDIVKTNRERYNVSFIVVDDNVTSIDALPGIAKVSEYNIKTAILSNSIPIFDFDVLENYGSQSDLYGIDKEIFIFSKSPLSIVSSKSAFLNTISSRGDNNLCFYVVKNCSSIRYSNKIFPYRYDYKVDISSSLTLLGKYILYNPL